MLEKFRSQTATSIDAVRTYSILITVVPKFWQWYMFFCLTFFSQCHAAKIPDSSVLGWKSSHRIWWIIPGCLFAGEMHVFLQAISSGFSTHYTSTFAWSIFFFFFFTITTHNIYTKFMLETSYLQTSCCSMFVWSTNVFWSSAVTDKWPHMEWHSCANTKESRDGFHFPFSNSAAKCWLLTQFFFVYSFPDYTKFI